MKILVFSPYYPPHIGGLESHADEFNKYLSQKGVDITVFTPRLPQDAPEKEIKYNDVKIIRFPAFEIIYNYPLPKFWRANFWKLFLSLFKKKFDIVISRTRFFNTSLLAFFYAKLKKVRWIHIEHGSDFVKTGGRHFVWVAWIYDNTLGKLILKMADKVVANSNASAAFCRKIAKNINCSVIYRGIEMEKILAATPNMDLRNKYSGKTIITFLGRLFDGKGVSDLISALAGLKNVNYICFIIGDGPEKEKLEAQTRKLGIENKVIFFGFRNFDEYIRILKISDIFVNPSYTEGLPTTVAEAALCRNAIVATNVGGTPEIITGNGNGFLIEPKNINLLKEKLEILINDKNLRENFGNNAYAEVKNKFDWNNSMEKYLKLFSTLSTP